MTESSAEGRTEEPTERRMERARRAGQVAISRDLTAGLAFASACVVLVAGGKACVGGTVTYLQTALASAASANFVLASVSKGLYAAFAALWLPVGVVFAATILAGIVQTRGNFATESLRADARRLRPRLGRLLGRDHVIDAAMDLCKIAALCAVAFWSVRPCLSALAALAGAGAARVLGVAGVLAGRLGIHLAITMVGLGFVDYLWQVGRHRNRLRMTRDEARRERKESEGDPEYKAERRRIHRELQMEGAIRDVRAADLVLVEPGLAAVAIRYSGSGDSAPVLVARGEHLRGRTIEAVARAAGVASFVEPALVRTLTFVEEGEEIPEALYSAVAELMVKARTMIRFRLPEQSGKVRGEKAK